MLASSPVSNDCLRQGCKTLQRHLRMGASRIPTKLREDVEALINRLKAELESDEIEVSARIGAIRDLEALDNKLRGRSSLSPQLYSDGMLGVIKAWDPITIRECVDYRWIATHMVRYEERARRSLARLKWFLERCGVVGDESEADLKPWQLPYAHLDASKELLWGRIRKNS